MQLPEIILDIGTNYYELAKAHKVPPIEAAKAMIRQAKLDCADAVKFQWYKAERLVRKDTPAYWGTDRTQFEVFKSQDKFGFDEYAELKAYCDQEGIEFMATAFDEDSLEQLNPLVKRHKIASCDITHPLLLEQVASYGKPVILSTGAATVDEINDAMLILGPVPVTLLHCVLQYPTPFESANLDRIRTLAKGYHRTTNIGYSDHCCYNEHVLLVAWLLGARVIEKHFTLTHDLKGNDHEHAIDPLELSCWRATMIYLLDVMNDESSQTEARRLARRGVYLSQDVRRGDVMSIMHVDFLRPQNDGMSPMQFHYRVKDGELYRSDFKKGDQVLG